MDYVESVDDESEPMTGYEGYVSNSETSSADYPTMGSAAATAGAISAQLMSEFVASATTAIRAEYRLKKKRKLRKAITAKQCEAFDVIGMDRDELAEHKASLTHTVKEWKRVSAKYEIEFAKYLRPTPTVFEATPLEPIGDWIQTPVPALPMGKKGSLTLLMGKKGSEWDEKKIDEELARRINTWNGESRCEEDRRRGYTLHSDGFLRLIMYVAGLEESAYCRNWKNPNAPDFAIFVNGVPVVIVAEAVPGCHYSGEKPILSSHAHFSPHVAQLPFLITITMKDNVQWVTVVDKNRKPTTVYGLGGYHESLEMSIIAINIGRVLRYWIHEKCIESPSPEWPLRFYHWVKRGRGKEIFATLGGVLVRISKNDETTTSGLHTGTELLNHLVEFYIKCANVPCLEKMETHKDNVLHLSPLGRARRPASLGEFCDALQCVISAVYGIHKQGFVHTSIKWSNIVEVCSPTEQWCLVDCYDVCVTSDTAQCTAMARYRGLPNGMWTEEKDCEQLAELLTVHAAEPWFQIDQETMQLLATQLRAHETLETIVQTLSSISN